MVQIFTRVYMGGGSFFIQFFANVITNFTLARDLNTFFKKYTSEVEMLHRRKTRLKDFWNFLKWKCRQNRIKLNSMRSLWLCGKKNSNRRSSVKKVFLDRNFAKFAGKHLCQNPFFNKVAGVVKFLRTYFLTEHLQATASKVWKECRTNFRFSNWYFQIKFCFKAKYFFSLPRRFYLCF